MLTAITQPADYFARLMQHWRAFSGRILVESRIWSWIQNRYAALQNFAVCHDDAMLNLGSQRRAVVASAGRCK
jgi:hypothetical protein